MRFYRNRRIASLFPILRHVERLRESRCAVLVSESIITEISLPTKPSNLPLACPERLAFACCRYPPWGQMISYYPATHLAGAGSGSTTTLPSGCRIAPPPSLAGTAARQQFARHAARLDPELTLDEKGNTLAIDEHASHRRRGFASTVCEGRIRDHRGGKKAGWPRGLLPWGSHRSVRALSGIRLVMSGSCHAAAH